MQTKKPFVVGGVKFSAIRHWRPTPHWRIRTDENGTVFHPGTAGISTKSVPKMIADVEDLFTRLKRDEATFRYNFDLPVAEKSCE